MPYYFGADSPGWDEYEQRLEAETSARGPLDRFTYVEPWEAKTSLLHFSRTPRTASERDAADQRAIRRPGTIENGSPEEWVANYHAEQKREAEEALESVAIWAAAFRAAGVRRVLIRYDGGNDEGFTHFEALELADGSRLTRQDARARDVVRAAIEATGDKLQTNEFEKYGYLEILADAVVAFLGPGFGTGEYEMFGAITVDCEACTITDEKDPSRAFPGR
jgi:hypothetical protein